MITIDGREFSEETIKMALEAHGSWGNKIVLPTVGDVVCFLHDEHRLIVFHNGLYLAVDKNGRARSERTKFLDTWYDVCNYEVIGKCTGFKTV